MDLSKINKCHLTHLTDLKNESWFNTHSIAIINNDDQNEFYEKLIKDKSKLFLVAKHQIKLGNVFYNTDVGVFKISNIDYVNQSADVGWDIFKAYRQQGFGRDLVQTGVDFCFEILNLHRLNAEILVHNKISKKCAINAGFISEGIKKESVFRCGQRIDSEFFGCTRNIWNSILNYRYSDRICNKNV